MTTVLTRNAISESISLLEGVRELFDTYFDKSYLSGVIEELAIDRTRVHTLYYNLHNLQYFRVDKMFLTEIIDLLEYYSNTLKFQLQPVLRDQLGISGFNRNSKPGSYEYVMKSFIVHAFPSNLETLDEYIKDLQFLLSKRTA